MSYAFANVIDDLVSAGESLVSDAEGAGRDMLSDAGKAAVEGASPVILARLKADLPNITSQAVARVRPALEAEVATALRSGKIAAGGVGNQTAKRTIFIGAVMVAGIFAAAYVAYGGRA